MDWQPIETAPKGPVAVDLWGPNGRFPDCTWEGSGWFCRWTDDFLPNAPTHWMWRAEGPGDPSLVERLAGPHFSGLSAIDWNGSCPNGLDEEVARQGAVRLMARL